MLNLTGSQKAPSKWESAHGPEAEQAVVILALSQAAQALGYCKLRWKCKSIEDSWEPMEHPIVAVVLVVVVVVVG